MRQQRTGIVKPQLAQIDHERGRRGRHGKHAVFENSSLTGSFFA
jgi:hypothetical protein